MWASAVYTLISFGVTGIGIYYIEQHKGFTAVVFWAIAAAFMTQALFHANTVGVMTSKIVGDGNYYEVILAVPVPGKGTLVYAVQLDDENKGKADILAEYPMKGYKIVLIGAKSYLLPVNTTVATDDKGETFFVSEDGEVFSVPMALKAEGPVNPPLLSSEVMSQTGGGIRLVQWVKDIRNPPMSFPEDDIPGKGEEKALLVAEYGQETTLTVLVPFVSWK